MKNKLVKAAARLRDEAGRLSFSSPVEWVYNPLSYAWKPHMKYLEKFGGGKKKALFLGMNPGPWGMAQTGVPFGEINAVTHWMGIKEPVGRPEREHPKRGILGFECPRSEVSGRRLWDFAARQFGAAENFFSRFFVANYCPLVFMGESGKNITPNTLSRDEREPLFALCDAHLREVIDLLEPEICIGIGGFAAERLKKAAGKTVRIEKILHPSPASPAANRGWDEKVSTQLKQIGVL